MLSDGPLPATGHGWGRISRLDGARTSQQASAVLWLLADAEQVSKSRAIQSLTRRAMRMAFAWAITMVSLAPVLDRQALEKLDAHLGGLVISPADTARCLRSRSCRPHRAETPGAGALCDVHVETPRLPSWHRTR
ncbi:hypothetical protein GCM10010308_14650 [Streptomyces vinaceusdrappus]|nr:hypothetical protein GCM10010301_18860 [Streptomyces plicatus]GHC03237.1 hypothetical protein GCM10010308_14650 [Streptomyces vinaceusdrappus]